MFWQTRPAGSPTRLRLSLALLLAGCGGALAGGIGSGPPPETIASGTVTSSDPRSGGVAVTPEQMREAKPMPLPSRSRPPAAEQPVPAPPPGPAGHSPPSPGGPPQL